MSKTSPELPCSPGHAEPPTPLWGGEPRGTSQCPQPWVWAGIVLRMDAVLPEHCHWDPGGGVSGAPRYLQDNYREEWDFLVRMAAVDCPAGLRSSITSLSGLVQLCVGVRCASSFPLGLVPQHLASAKMPLRVWLQSQFI